MKYNVITTRKATRQLLKLPKQMQLRVTGGIRGLSDSATWGDVRRLVNLLVLRGLAPLFSLASLVYAIFYTFQVVSANFLTFSQNRRIGCGSDNI